MLFPFKSRGNKKDLDFGYEKLKLLIIKHVVCKGIKVFHITMTSVSSEISHYVKLQCLKSINILGYLVIILW